jgi:hypothetical protein
VPTGWVHLLPGAPSAMLAAMPSVMLAAMPSRGARLTSVDT